MSMNTYLCLEKAEIGSLLMLRRAYDIIALIFGKNVMFGFLIFGSLKELCRSLRKGLPEQEAQHFLSNWLTD